MPFVKRHPDKRDVRIMSMLKQYPPATPTEVQKEIGIAKTTLYQRLHWLNREGYIKTVSNRRVLTEKGFEYLASPHAFTQPRY